MKILFISRAYPPVVGGIENHNFELSKRLPKESSDFLLNTRGKKFLPFFLPFALWKVLTTARKYDVILLGDGVLSVIGFAAVKVSRKVKVACVIHGLDVTHKNFIYQIFWVRLFLPCLHLLIAVSQETKNIAIQHGLKEKNITVVPNGVDLSFTPEAYSRNSLSEMLTFDTKEKTILLTHGRLAKRKGVNWFLQNVLPGLPSNIHYVVSGDGPEKEEILESIRIHGLEERVTLLGRISEEEKNILLHTIDIFVQPNISVPGDMEGFGIAVIEATSLARPVIASNIEGLRDAIADGKNGIGLPSGNTRAWRDTIVELSRDKEKMIALGKANQLYTQTYFSWEKVSAQYLRKLEGLLG